MAPVKCSDPLTFVGRRFCEVKDGRGFLFLWEANGSHLETTGRVAQLFPVVQYSLLMLEALVPKS